MPDMEAILMPAFIGFMAATILIVLALMFVGGRLARRDAALAKQHLPKAERRPEPAYRIAA